MEEKKLCLNFSFAAEETVRNLLQRMTLEEETSQLRSVQLTTF